MQKKPEYLDHEFLDKLDHTKTDKFGNLRSEQNLSDEEIVFKSVKDE